MSRPVWTMDGQELVYFAADSTLSEAGSLYRVPVNGSAEPRRLEFAGQGVSAPALSRRGDRLTYSRSTGQTDLWAWERGEKILFLPDQHLGRNTAYKMGIPLDEMVVWDPDEVLAI